MAVNTTVDNAVIDYTAIASLLQTVKSHDDLFVQFSSGSLGNIAVNESANGDASQVNATAIPASNFLVQGVQAQGTLSGGSCSFTVYWGEAFGIAPIVTATPQIQNSNSRATALISSVDTSKATIVVYDSGSTAGAAVLLNVLALGTRS